MKSETAKKKKVKPIPPSRPKEKMTKEGYELIKNKIEDLEKKLAELRLFKGQEAVFAGDSWHDNPTLYRVEAEERVLMNQIAELTLKFQNAEIVEVLDQFSMGALGSKVKIRDSYGLVDTYRIVSDTESNPREGKISNKSPLGNALLGKVVGDLVTYMLPGGEEETVEVLEIS